MKKKSDKSIIVTAGLLLLVVIITYIVSTFFYQFLLIRGESMSPTYHNLQLVILEKRVDEYMPGDVIAFKCDGLEQLLIKRIVAGPGDIVCILNGTLYVNDDICAIYSENFFDYAGILQNNIYLEGNQYIVIGDNMEKSRDSRYEEVGIVLKENIIGRVL